LIIIVWPFNEASDNYISIFNEFMNSSYLCIYLSLSGLQPTFDLREILGWALVCVSLFTVFVNFAKLIYVKGRALVRYLRKKNRTQKKYAIEKNE
jgi:hypothetical protein